MSLIDKKEASQSIRLDRSNDNLLLSTLRDFNSSTSAGDQPHMMAPTITTSSDESRVLGAHDVSISKGTVTTSGENQLSPNDCLGHGRDKFHGGRGAESIGGADLGIFRSNDGVRDSGGAINNGIVGGNFLRPDTVGADSYGARPKSAVIGAVSGHATSNDAGKNDGSGTDAMSADPGAIADVVRDLRAA